MATRWRWSEARRRTARGGRRTGAALLAALVLAAGAACVTRTSISYLPSPEQPRLDLARAQATLAQFVGLECERLREAGRAEGSAQLRLAQDDSGLVTQADLERSSGDARVDGVMGAIAAQLRLEPPTGRARPAVRAGYRCTEDGGIATTFERA